MGIFTTQEEAEAIVIARGYELVGKYNGTKKNVDIYCPTCQKIFSMSWNNFHGKKRNCKFCNKKNFKNTRQLSFDTIKKDFESHGYVLLATPEEYLGNKTLLRCICPCGNETVKRYRDVLLGAQCWSCGNEKRSIVQRTSPAKADQTVAKTGLRVLEYSYKNIFDKFPLECLECKFQFRSTLAAIQYRNVGCPQCTCSYGEYKLLQFVKKIPGMEWCREFKFEHDIQNGVTGCYNVKPLLFDMWIEPFNSNELLIEIDGIQHFESVRHFGGLNKFNKTRKNDIIKSLYCHNNNIPLLRIHYEDIDNLIEHVLEFMKKYKYNKDGNILMYSDPEKYKDLIEGIDTASKK